MQGKTIIRQLCSAGADYQCNPLQYSVQDEIYTREANAAGKRAETASMRLRVLMNHHETCPAEPATNSREMSARDATQPFKKLPRFEVIETHDQGSLAQIMTVGLLLLRIQGQGTKAASRVIGEPIIPARRTIRFRHLNRATNQGT